MDGLVLALDAGNTKSYSGSGTTWTDLSLNSNTGTLVGGPSYGSTSGGSIAFDGLNDNVSIGTNRFSFDSSPGTLSALTKTTSLYPDRAIVSYGASVINQARILGIAASNFYFSGYGSTITASGASYDDWFNIVGVYDGTNASMYVNGELVAGPTLQSWNTAASNAGIGKNVGNDGYWRGNVSQVSVYNRALSAAEIQQNYNALKSRYDNYVSEAYIRDPEEPPPPFEYWIATLGNVRDLSLRGIRVDSSGDIYCCGTINGTSSANNRGILVKYDQNGTFKWQRTFATTYVPLNYSQGSVCPGGLTIDSSGNVYVIAKLGIDGRENSDNIYPYEVTLIKYNSSGVLQWKVGIPKKSVLIKVDNSGNIYTSGDVTYRYQDGSGTFYYAIFIKYNSSGAIQWQRKLSPIVQSTNPTQSVVAGGYSADIAVDSSGNLYVRGLVSTAVLNAYEDYLAKYNNLGVLQWKIKFGTNGAGSNGTYFFGSRLGDIVVDAAGQYIYSVGDDSRLTKFDTSGQFIWQKTIRTVPSNTLISFVAIKMDTSGEYLYAVGTVSRPHPNSTQSDGVMVKLNISGETIWGKLFGKASVTTNIVRDLDIDSSGNFYSIGYSDSVGSAVYATPFITRLPGDGSYAGTYGAYTYADLPVTSVSNSGISTYVYSAATITADTTGFSTYTSSLITSETSTLTYSTISVP